MKNILKHIIFPHTIATYDFFKYFRYLVMNHTHYIDTFYTAEYDSKYGCTEDYFTYQKTCPQVKPISHTSLLDVNPDDHHQQGHYLYTKSCWDLADFFDYPEGFDTSNVQHIGFLRPSDTSEVITFYLYGKGTTFCLEDICKFPYINIQPYTDPEVIQSGIEVVSPVKTNYPNNLGYCISEQKIGLHTNFSGNPYVKCTSSLNSSAFFSLEGKLIKDYHDTKSIIFDADEKKFLVSYEITSGYIDLTFKDNYITGLTSSTIKLYIVVLGSTGVEDTSIVSGNCSVEGGTLRITLAPDILGIAFIKIEGLVIAVGGNTYTFNTIKGTNYIKIGYKTSIYYEKDDF